MRANFGKDLLKLGRYLCLLSVFAASCKSVGLSHVKEDFKAKGSREFWVTGSDTVTLEQEYATKTEDERLERARYLAGVRRIAIAWILNAYLADKEVDDPNVNWGKFNAQVRFGDDTQTVDVVKRDPNALIYGFDFKFGVAGYTDLIANIRADQQLTGVGSDFSLMMPDLTNKIMADVTTVHHEWFRNDPWAFWAPELTPNEPMHAIPMTIVQQPKESDAFFPFDQLTADGHLSIAIHFGWDGGNPGVRNDITLSEQLFNDLVSKGFKAPTASFATYLPFAATTPPFVKMIKVNGKDVAVEVAVYFGGQSGNGINVPGPDIETDAGGDVVGNKMLESLATKRVIMYIGHSGIRRGFNLANWAVTDKGNVPPGQMATTPMLNSPQLVVAEGCQTYYLADAFWANPAKKDRRNLNLITSLGFTASDSITTATRLIDAFIAQGADPAHPRMVTPRVSAVLKELNLDYKIPFRRVPGATATPATSSVGSTATSLALKEGDADDPLFPVYGLNGVAEDPQYDPLAQPSSLCHPCSNSAACGGDGSICTEGNGRQQFCSAGCTTDDGCVAFANLASNGRAAASYSCVKGLVAEDRKLGVCVPQGFQCPSKGKL